MEFKRMHKLFKELKDEEFIYYINPFIAVREMKTPLELLLLPTLGGQAQLIQPVKIKHIKGIPDEPAYSKWVEIEYYRPESILHSPDLNAIPTVKLRFNGERNFAFTLLMLEGKELQFPVPYCTSRDYLIEYVRSNWGALKNVFNTIPDATR